MGTTMAEQPCYTLIHCPPDSDQPNEMQLKESLEKGETKERVVTLKRLIYMVQNGEKVSQGLLMMVIRFCLPSQDHLMKKLLLIFWEVVPKTTPDGKLLHEMILVCDAYRRDLQHPNEFIQGSTLRFLCKLKEPELLEPLMPSIKKCIEHRHSYVRRNAVLAIYTIYRNFDFLAPDAPEMIYNFLETEQDASCKRNAFMMLIHVDQARALDYLSGCIEQVTSFGEILQLIIVELIYKVCHANPAERARFIRCVYNLLQSSAAAVRYEAAGTLLTLSAAPTAVRAAATAYIDLIVKESDNNVKLIVLDRLIALRNSRATEKVLQELVMDILRVLSSPDLEVRRKTLGLALELVTSRNVEDMVLFLRKEIGKTTEGAGEGDDTGKYRQALVQTLHTATIRFPDVAAAIVPALMEFLADDSEVAAADVLVFVREAVQRLPHLRPVILAQLIDVFGTIRNVKIFRSALWILGEYSDSRDSIQGVMTLIRQSLGDLPLVDSELKEAAAIAEGISTEPEDTELKAQVKQLVTADGTYATQSALVNGPSGRYEGGAARREKPPLRRFLLDGDFFVASVLATVLTKLTIHYEKLSGAEHRASALGFAAEAMFILASMMHLGKSGLPKTAITEDDLDRLSLSVKLLAERWPPARDIFLSHCRRSLDLMLDARSAALTQASSTAGGGGDNLPQLDADAPIGFTQLMAKLELGGGKTATEDLFAASMSQALGTAAKSTKFDPSASKLGKVTQLAGFSDPVYAEAYVNVNQYDIVLDVLIVNQTGDTLESVTLELATLGDLKLVEKPTPITLAAYDFANIKASVKVASTENGVIFSSIVYDVRGSTSDRNCVFLEDIHIDIMDYIVPANCSDTDFRRMWQEFEWENKVTVNTPIVELSEFLRHISRTTNMRCLTPAAALGGDCGFLAANFYARSIFGEDALANISIEKTSDEANVSGHIRIRAKSQGMALSLGDKVNSAQKEPPRDRQRAAAKTDAAAPDAADDDHSPARDAH